MHGCRMRWRRCPRHRPDKTSPLKPVKHLRERIGTVTRINAKSCSLLCDGEQWRVSRGLLRKIIDV